MEQVALFFISLVANIFSAFSGGGAGLIQLPALIFLGLPFAIALATHKVASVALGIGATVRHLREEPLERRLALTILLFGLPGVVLGAGSILQVPERLAEVALGVLTTGLGIYSWLNPELGQSVRPAHRDRHGSLVGGIILFIIGIGLDYRRAIAYTLILVGVFWNGGGALTLGILGEIRWSWLPALLAGSLLVVYIGAHMAIKSGNRWIKRAFEIVTLLVGVKLIAG